MFGLFEKSIPATSADTIIKAAGFGKIPQHSDFVRCNLSSREITGFEKWLQEGVGCITRKYPKGWPAVYRDFACHHFVMTGSDQNHNLIGSLIGSQDKSGRIYPFATLTTVNGPVFKKHRAALPLICRCYFDETRKLLENLESQQSVRSLTDHLEKLSGRFQQPQQRNLLEIQIQELSSRTMKEYWDNLSEPLPADNREEFLFTFFDLLRTVVKRGATKSHWGIRIPLPETEDPTPFVVFWVQVIESILEDRFWRAHYFWNPGTTAHGSNLTLFFRELPPSHLLPLLDHHSKDNVIFDVRRESRELTAFSSKIDLRRLLEQDQLSLLEVLYRIGRREML